MRAYVLTAAREACRRLCGGAGRNSLPAREKWKGNGGPAERNASWGVSEQWSLKTVWGVGYKFEVVSGA